MLRKFFFISAAILVVIGPAKIAAQPPSDHKYYIDFAGGSDDAAGTSQSSAWKHSPGDPGASGQPARASLSPGDTIIFRAGVVYRGSIQIKADGLPGRPITYSGLGWGPGRAIMSGRDAYNITPQPCSSSPICSRLQTPDRFVVIDLPVPVSTYSQISLEGHILLLSELPKPAEAFWFDDISNYVEVGADELKPLADGKTWQLQNTFIRKSLGNDAEDDLLILILGYPNVITSGSVTSYDQATSSVLFQPTRFQRNDKAPVVFALANHPRLITQPYEYATINHGKSIIVQAPPNSTKLEVSQRPWCFTAVNQKDIAIKGFEIEGYADGPAGGGGSALAVRNVSDILFDGNEVHDLENWAGGGAIGGEPIADFTATNNHFYNLPHGSGIRIGKGSNVQIARNEFDNIGRTGILIMNSQHSLVDHNILRRLYGSHGNGISIYLDNHDVTVTNNLVTDSTRAVTFEGVGHPAAPNNIVLKNNLLKASGSDGVALQSWGGNTNGVTIERNVLLIDNGVHALRLSGKDSNVTVHQNVIEGYQAYPVPLPSDTSIAGNLFVSESRGSTDGNQVELGSRAAADTLFNDASSPDAKICRFLLNGTRGDVGIGPKDTCKS